jgi:GR25 family glycosyltransferase involved in LPS biosynthesis
MRIVLINLDCSPDQLRKFKETNSHFEFVRFSAIDGTTMGRDAAYGCAMSHLTLWRQVISAGEPLTICEDDAIFSRFFEDDAERILATVPPGWDIILWGWNYDTTLHFYMGPSAFPSLCSVQFDEDQLRLTADQFQDSAMGGRAFRLTRAYGTVCYTISPAGAEKLLEHCSTLFAPIDIMLNEAYARMNSFVSFPPLVITKNEHEALL